jgi:hypothetical protein
LFHLYFSDRNWLNEDFSGLFIEDSIKEESNYIDYLCLIHSKIIERMEKDDDA